MKKRILRKPINYALIFITMILFIFVACIDDMELSFISIYLLLVGIIAINIYVLYKYGDNKLLYDKD